MKQLHYRKSGIEIKAGVLPDLLKEGRVFRELSKGTKKEHIQYKSRYRQMLYAKMDEILGDKKPKSVASYKQWFLEPEKRVNAAFLENKFINEERWHLIVNSMYHALVEVLMFAKIHSEENAYMLDEQAKTFSKILNEYVSVNNKGGAA